MIATASDFIDWGSTLFDVANTLIYVDAVHYFRDGVLLLIKASYIDHPRLRGAHRGVNDELRTAGVIRLPLETTIPLSIPAKQTPVSFPGANVSVATPDLSVTAKFSANRFIVLPDGLHVYGQINVASGG